MIALHQSLSGDFAGIISSNTVSTQSQHSRLPARVNWRLIARQAPESTYAGAACPSTLLAYSSTLPSLIPNVSTTAATFIASPRTYPSISAAKLF
jgi:hypothetical protein